MGTVLYWASFLPQAQGSVLFEPYAGYAMSDLKMTGTATNPELALQNQTTTASVDGFAYGGRLGMRFGMFFVAGEFQGMRGRRQLKGTSEATDWRSQSTFATLGIEPGFGLRLMGSKLIQHRVELMTVPESTFYMGDGYKLGLGFRFMESAAVNAEYVVYNIKKTNYAHVEYEVDRHFSQFRASAIIVTLSLPFEFF